MSRARTVSGAGLSALLVFGSLTGVALAAGDEDLTGSTAAATRASEPPDEAGQSGDQTTPSEPAASPEPAAPEEEAAVDPGRGEGAADSDQAAVSGDPAGTGAGEELDEKPPPDESSEAADAVEDEPGAISPMSVPAPGSLGPGEAAVSVKVGGLRTGSTVISPLAGATLGLFASLSATSPVGEAWATCVSDADGDCTFIIPETGGSFVNPQANRDRELYVKAVSAPSGYTQYLAARLGVGGTVTPATYGFRVGSGTQLRSGNVYTSSGQGADFMLGTGQTGTASGGVFQFVRDNPVVQQCGLDVALVLDLSGSIAGYEDDLAGAANTLVTALTGTDSSVSLYTFATNSPAGSVPNHPAKQSVSTAAGAQTVKSWYSDADGDATFTASGGTNWDRGMWSVVSSGNAYDVAIVITDGNPTYYASPVEGYGNYTRFRELENGIFSANAIKDDGARVVALGVGSGVDSTASGLNLASISGPAAGSDYFQTTDYDQAAAVLREMISQSCAGTVTVVKQVVPEGTTGEDVTGATPAGGWTFGAASSNPDVTLAASGTTSTGTGAVNFPLAFATGTESTDLAFVEQPSAEQQDKYSLVTQGGRNAVCVDLQGGQSVDVTNQGELGFSIAGVDGGSNISCTVYNREVEQSASVVVDKHWVVNGTDYANGDQPGGLSAGLVLEGPGVASPSPQPWGSERMGYAVGETPSIDETTTIDPVMVGCTLDSQRVSEANGQAVDVDISGDQLYRPSLAVGENTFTITNTVTCETTLTLLKQVVGGEAEPGDWTFTVYTVPDDPGAGSPVAPFDGATLTQQVNGSFGVTSAIDPGTYQFAEADGPAWYYQQFRGDPDTQQETNPLSTGSWDCTHVDDSLTRVDEWNDGLNGGADVALGTHVSCIAYNLTGEVTLLKHVENDHGGTLSADEWSLTATPDPGVEGLGATSVAGDEKVTEANTFTVRPLHGYSISEAPAGGGDPAYFQVKVQRYLGEVAPDGSVDHDDDSLWEDVDPASVEVPNEDNVHDVYRFVNADVPLVSLPLTGGMASDLFTLIGGSILAVAVALGGWSRIRRAVAMRRSL
jgi:hypothetical protein